MAEARLVHGTCVAIGGRGVLLEGPPGAGKSDLALRLIDQPGTGLTGQPKAAVLIADDQVALTRVGAALRATAPAALRGLVEIRGLGLVPLGVGEAVDLALLVNLAPATAIERLPAAGSLCRSLLGVRLAAIAVDPSQASAPARIRAALDALEAGFFPACQTP
jgi:serine kinase of HPr protein (carbohydrate metabolism regulator)